MKIGMIGAGNMGSALAAAVSQGQDAPDVYLTDASAARAAEVAQRIGAHVTDNVSAAETCDILFLAVKPNVLPGVLGEIRTALSSRSTACLLVSMAAGVTLQTIYAHLGGVYPVIRIMPNTPAAIGEGMILYSVGENVTEAQKTAFVRVLSAAGELDALPEGWIDAGCAVSGCGPAFVYMMIEAMADGAVECGLPRDKAQKYATQTLLGAAKLLASGTLHPGAQKDAVCSPGGSTIAGVHALEHGAFRATVMDAVTAAYRKTKELAKN